MNKPKQIKDEPFIIRLIKAPFRLHDFDLENVECINQGSVDKDVTGEPHVLLYFAAFCRNCGQPVQVSRETFIDREISFRKRWFCFHQKAAFQVHLEQVKEKAAEMVAMRPEDYEQFNHDLKLSKSNADIARRITDKFR